MNKEERIKADLEKLKKQILEDRPARVTLSSNFLLEIIEIIENQEQDINKLINYIAIKEDLDFKQVVEKFELGE